MCTVHTCMQWHSHRLPVSRSRPHKECQSRLRDEELCAWVVCDLCCLFIWYRSERREPWDASSTLNSHQTMCVLRGVFLLLHYIFSKKIHIKNQLCRKCFFSSFFAFFLQNVSYLTQTHTHTHSNTLSHTHTPRGQRGTPSFHSCFSLSGHVGILWGRVNHWITALLNASWHYYATMLMEKPFIAGERT